MKTILISFATSILTASTYAQTLKPEQYAVIPTKDIQIEIAKNKRKDGSYPIPYLTNEKNLKFSTNGDFLYILNDAEKDEGKFFVYNTFQKKIVKSFIIPKTGMFSSGGFVVNSNNSYQLAVAISKNEILVISDWIKAPEDAFVKKKGEGVIRIGAQVEYGKFEFSGDGKSLYIMEGETNPLKIADLTSGKITSKKLPKGKVLYYRNSSEPFIGNDEALIIFQKDPKLAGKTAEIYHIPSEQITRTYDVSGFSANPKNFSNNPHILCINLDGFTLNLRTGEKNLSSKKIYNALASAKDNSATMIPVSDNGYAVIHLYYKEESVTNIKTGDKYTTHASKNNLYFFDKNGNKSVSPNFPDVNKETPWTALTNLQISPNGKYIVFRHEDINNDKNSKWIIATL